MSEWKIFAMSSNDIRQFLVNEAIIGTYSAAKITLMLNLLQLLHLRKRLKNKSRESRNIFNTNKLKTAFTN